MRGGGPDWRTKLVLVGAGVVLTLVLLVLALVYGAGALNLAYLQVIADPALAACATGGTLLLAIGLLWLLLRFALRPARRKASAPVSHHDLLDEGLALARRHPFMATAGAVAAGFAASKSESADALVAGMLARQVRDE